MSQIEELYNANVKVYVQAAVEVLELLDAPRESQYDEVFAFERCQSRLLEMSSEEYHAKPWKG